MAGNSSKSFAHKSSRSHLEDQRYFPWRGVARYCEGVPLSQIASRCATPTYVYSQSSITAAYREYTHAFRGLPTTICYSVKANSNLEILKLLARLGSGFDIVSGGELYRLRHAGISGQRIVFSGVGKTREEIREALREKIFLFNVESPAELDVLISEASRLNRPAPAAIRINPDVQAGGHAHISTGRQQHKFGMEWPDARRSYLAQQNSPWIAWKGISAHIGSAIFTKDAIRLAASRLANFAADLQRARIPITHIDFGGGLGVRYADEKPISIAEYARA